MKRKGIISIDFWNTLVQANTNGEARNVARLNALNDLATKHNVAFLDHQLKAAYNVAKDRFEEIWLNEARTLQTSDLIKIVLDELNIPATEEESAIVSKVYQESLWDGPPELAPGVLDAIPALAERYDLAIISDTMYSPGRVLKVYLDNKGILKHFDAFVFSDEVGYSKPDIRAFDKIREDLKAESNEIYYHIGDLEKTDMKGAKQANAIAIQYTELSPEQHTNYADKVFHSWADICEALL